MNPRVIAVVDRKGGGNIAPRGSVPQGKYLRVWIPNTLLERIRKKREELGLASISEAIRYLVNKGLEEVDS